MQVVSPRVRLRRARPAAVSGARMAVAARARCRACRACRADRGAPADRRNQSRNQITRATMTTVVKSTHPSFPEEGVDVHVSVADAVRHGIKPGDPAVVEVIVRPY